MNHTKSNNNLKLQDFPEEITDDGLRIYGETSYENMMAVLSQFLHCGLGGDTMKRKEIVLAITI